MRKALVCTLLSMGWMCGLFAFSDSIIIPLNRQYFHDKIDQQQLAVDKLDRKVDQRLFTSGDDSLKARVNVSLFDRVDECQWRIESNDSLKSNNDKVRHLTYLENYLQVVRRGLLRKEIAPSEIPQLFSGMLKNMEVADTLHDYLSQVRSYPYSLAKALTDIFPDFPLAAAAKKIVYEKYALLHPDQILSTLDPYLGEPFADRLLEAAARNNPSRLYTFAQSKSTLMGKAIHQSASPLVRQIALLTETPNGLMYFPFLDNLAAERQSLQAIESLIWPTGKPFDSLAYFRLLVQLEMQYYRKIRESNDTPVAMFGANGLRETLHDRAIRHFIEPINQLHDEVNLNIRMKPIDSLQPIDLYFMMVTGENDLYTSSFKHSFNRMVERMGKNPRGDSLLLKVGFDQFRKFIKVLAAYNRLDPFLKTMPPGFAASLMKTFVSDLDGSAQLEASIDVADSYASIQNPTLRSAMLQHIVENETLAEQEGRLFGKHIYGLLKQIFISIDSSQPNKNPDWLNAQQINRSSLTDDSGRIVEQVFFYGDDDGRLHFPGFLQSFSAAEWKITHQPEWVEIRSRKGNIHIYANRPLDYDANLDDSAQAHLIRYLDEREITPSIVVHRGHSYWLPATIRRMPLNTKIMLIGSCGGYKNLKQILTLSPDAAIISTKEIGAGDINRPILNYIHQSLMRNEMLDWKKMWEELTVLFTREKNKSIRETWENYIPPYRNLGALFFKAYQRMEVDQAP